MSLHTVVLALNLPAHGPQTHQRWGKAKSYLRLEQEPSSTEQRAANPWSGLGKEMEMQPAQAGSTQGIEDVEFVI